MTLMEAIGGTDITQYKDQYREAMEAVSSAKAAGVEPPEMEAPAEPKGKVVDLMAALQDSVRAAKKSRGEETGRRNRRTRDQRAATDTEEDRREKDRGQEDEREQEEDSGREEVLEEITGIVTELRVIRPSPLR
ncbi:hypothetical protein ACIQPP_41430 [Streptomyces violaceusniger]|uniref:hypothetical protein n=1 Tax=Streptomyces violaceusniger TaxID=68280 RepID=UPI0009C2D124|nr:DNA repair protein [Streptomyces hygroscopicus]